MTPFEWVAVAVVASLSTARINRLFVWDVYPPVAWLRDKWDEWTGLRDSKGELQRDSEGNVLGNWTPLMHCGYCFGMYAAIPVLLTGWLSGWHTAWWIVNGWLALSYVGAIIMAFDGDD